MFQGGSLISVLKHFEKEKKSNLVDIVVEKGIKLIKGEQINF